MTRKEFNQRFEQIAKADKGMLRAIIADFHSRGIFCTDDNRPKGGAVDPREVAGKSSEETLLGMAEALLALKIEAEG